MADEPKPKRTKSGNHPAVVEYQATVREFQKEGSKALDDLDKKLEEYLAEEPVPVRRAAGGRHR